MKSKTKIEKQTKRKTSSDLVETIRLAKKNKKWLEVAGLLSTPRKERAEINLDKIDKESKEKESILIPGKVLSQGEITKKIRVVAMGFSESAKTKLLNAKCDIVYISDEIKNNPEDHSEFKWVSREEFKNIDKISPEEKFSVEKGFSILHGEKPDFA